MRDKEEIKESLVNNVKENDPTLDTEKGILYDFMISPVGEESYNLELSMDNIRQLETFQIGNALTEDEAETLAGNFGLSKPEPSPTTCKTVFYTATQPTEDINIERGHKITTVNELYNFYVQDTVTMYAENYENYYNPVTNRYEILVDIASYGVGETYELNIGTITEIPTPITGIDGCSNITPAIKDQSNYSNNDLVDLIRSKLTGISPDSGGSLIFRMIERFPSEIKEIKLVFSKDKNLFKRPIKRLGVDAYIKGEKSVEQTYEYRSDIGGENTFSLDRKPILNITTVKINGNDVNYSISEPHDSYHRSTRGTYNLILDTALSVGDLLYVSYNYNSVLYRLQKYFDGEEENGQPTMFGMDVLCREFIFKYIKINLKITVLPSFDKTYINNSVNTVIYNYIENDVKPDYLEASELSRNIKENVPGIQNIIINEFYPMDYNILDIETIELDKNEYPKIGNVILNIYK